MKSTITIIILFLLITNCRKETNRRTEYLTYYINSSIHTIKINNLENYTIEISPGKSHLNSYHVKGFQGDIPPVNLNMDTVEIIYNDTLSIKHPGSYTIRRDIRDPNSYVNEKKEGEYGPGYFHTYTFTNADFREADSIIN
tara:strand:+ start:628 stop:1050 length:423 start_codon:yes stop_codon:yes gene_type:complete